MKAEVVRREMKLSYSWKTFPGVHINRLAMKLDVMIQPIGKLRCMDVATCGRECFYCDWCKQTRFLLSKQQHEK